MKRLVLICAVMLGCGGGGPPNPPSPPGPTPLSFSNVQAANIATNGATISWNTNKNASSKVRYGTSPANLNLETPEDNAMVTSHSVPINSLTPGTQYHYSVVSRDTDGTVGSSNGFNFTTAQMTPPVLTFLGPDTVTVNPGATAQFAFTLTGSPAPTVDCSATLGTIVGLSGNMVTYRAPTPQGNVSDTLTCTADNGINPQGVDSITIIVPFQPNGAVITSISPETIYFRSVGIQGMVVRGANFAVGQPVSVNHGKLLGVFFVSSTELNVSWAADGDIPGYDPGEVELTVGTATTSFLFKGNFDTMTCSTTECFQLSQLPPGVVVVYDKNTGARKREFNIGSIANSIAWDNQSNLLLVTSDQGLGARTVDGAPAAGVNYDRPTTEIVARDGRACAASDVDGTLVFYDVVQGPTPFTLSPQIGGKPTPVAIGYIGTQQVCATFSVESLHLTVLRVPQNTILWQATVNGLRKQSELNQAAAQGGWRLKIFSSGSAAGIVALLHDEDRVAAFFNGGTELRRVTLSGAPFRMEQDEANGQVIVSKWNHAERKTEFDKVKVSTGQVTAVNNKVSFGATGGDPCGSVICAGNRTTAFARVPIN